MGKFARGHLWFFLLGILAGAVVAPFSVNAAIVYSQLSDVATTTDATLAFFKIPAGTSVPNGLKFMDLEAASGGTSHSFQAVVICRRFSDYTGMCPELPDFSITTTATSTTKAPTKYHLPFTAGSTTPLSSSRFYAFGINRTGGSSHGIQLRGVTTTSTCIITGCGLSGIPYVVLSDSVPEPATPDPVIIIPGILGSEKHNGEWVIDPILHTYDDLIATLDVNHYTPEVDLFTFPYDWRKSNVDTAILLKQKINAVKQLCNCQKVDLVAHSMGGLVARHYIQSDAYEHDVDQLIFLGTPHLGAPKAYLMWEGGEFSAINDFEGELTEKLLEHEAFEKGYSSLFAYLRTESIDSVRELLPISNYILDENILRNYPNNYPENNFLVDLDDGINRLLNSGIDIYNIVGNTNIPETITSIETTNPQEYLPLWAHGYPNGFYELFGNHGLIYGIGDKTVPFLSASRVDNNQQVVSAIHTALPSVAGANVYEILHGEAASVVVQENRGANIKLILIKIFSPADLFVIAPDGKKIGKDFTTGSEVNEIPNAFYTGFTTNTEYITILNPLDGEYKVTIQGTGSGAYTVETNYISDATSTEASFTGNTTPGLITELELPINNENPAIKILPSDLTPPTVTIVNPVSKDYLRSEQLPVNVTATDSESGVQSLGTLFDTFTTANFGSIDLFFQTLGNHVLTATSSDNVNNATTSLRAFRVIATASSTLSDIDRAYSLGWITKPAQDTFAKKLKACNVEKKSITTVTKTIVVTGRNGKPTTKKVYEKTEKVEIVFDKNCAKAILKELDKYRGKGLNEQAYQLLREDINWLINN